MNPTELAWAAGFFDGEGCVGIYPHKTHTGGNYQLRLSVINTDHSAVLKFRRMFVGTIRPRSRKGALGTKPCWVWEANDLVAEVALRLLIPFLLVKQEQARIALNFRLTYDQHRPRGGHLGRTLPEAILSSRARYAQEISDAKR